MTSRQFIALAAALTCYAAVAETRTITGRVTAPDGTALAAIDVVAQPIDIARCCASFASVRSAADGSFSLTVDPSPYVVWFTPHPPLNPTGARVDTTAGDVVGLQLVAKTGRMMFMADDPPRAALIKIESNGDYATIRGTPGAVSSRAFVMFTTLDTGDFSVTEARADGSFEARHFAPPAASVFIKSDPVGLVLSRALREVEKGGEGSLSGTSGTIVRVPAPATTQTGTTVNGTGLFIDADPRMRATFSFRGTLNTLRLRPGEPLRLQGTLRTEAAEWANVPTLTQDPALLLEILSDASGDTRSRQAIFSSALLTPTGLSMERQAGNDALGAGRRATFSKTAPNVLEAALDFSVTIPQSFPHGRYRAVLAVCCESDVPRLASDRRKLMVDKLNIQRRSTIELGVVEIGDPPVPRFHWTLLVDDLAGGARGVSATEDRGRWAVNSRIVTESDTGIIPRLDERTGQPILYRLEPFALTVSVGDRAIPPSVPTIPFRFPSGFLRAEIRGPDGSVRRLGPYPFVQSRSRTLTTRRGLPLDEGGGHLTDAYQLSTMRPEMETHFNVDGDHVITLEGEIEDVWGNTWRGGGTYPIIVGKPLIIDPHVLPGTPFEVGDSFTTGITFVPPVAADIETVVRFAPRSDARRMIQQTFRGRANRTGHFAGSPFTFNEPGEYRVDVIARYKDETGALWAAVKTSAGVVAPMNALLIAHGRRGADNQPSPQSWFARRSDGGSHMHVPFFSGDVAWQTKGDAAIPVVTFQDPSNQITQLLRSRVTMMPVQAFDNRATVGETPLFLSRADRVDPQIDPAKIDLWAYSYRSIQRPLVRVREQIGEELNLRSNYWRFNESYAGQAGVGSKGDLVNDFKFQYGAAVIRGPAIGEPAYAIYGSFFVLIRDDDPVGSRVFPPFQGNGGGPSGGPLFKLKGTDVDLFLHPTGLRPGSILHTGDTASFAGYVAPPLPGKVEFVVTAPSGRQRTISGTANKIGYFYKPESEFAVDEIGVWRARVKVVFDASTSAGQLTAPYPAGDVLGSRGGEFYFYVTDRASPSLSIVQVPAFVRASDGPIAFAITPPAGLSNVELYYTTMMPGFILEEGRTNSLNYIYDARRLNRDFPNLDIDDNDSLGGVDIITMSFMVSGTDGTGTRKHFARQVVLQGEQLHTPVQKPLPLRSRTVRR